MKDSTPSSPTLVDPLALSRLVHDDYSNVSLGNVNDHEIRMSVMRGPFRWHRHPDSDETFLAVDGGLVIEFEAGEVVLEPGQFLTVPRGLLHRTRPLSERSVNLTFERTAPPPCSRTDRAPRTGVDLLALARPIG